MTSPFQKQMIQLRKDMKRLEERIRYLERLAGMIRKDQTWEPAWPVVEEKIDQD